MNPLPAPRGAARALAVLEAVGNRVPDPVALFAGIGALVLLASAIGARLGLAVTHPGTGDAVGVVDLLASAGVRRIFTDAVKNFTGFPPLGAVLVAVLGIGLAEKSGLFDAALRRLVDVPARALTAALVFGGVNSSIAADAGFVVLVPLGAAVFAAAGRVPLAGLAAAFAGVSGGFAANLLITGLDPLLAGLTQAAARLVQPDAVVLPTANWWIMAASVPLLTVVGTVVTERWVEPRLGPPPPRAAALAGDPDATELAALRAATWTLLAAAAAVVLLGATILRTDEGALTPLYESTVVLVAAAFGAAGLVFGRIRGSIPHLRAASHAAAEAMGSMGGYLVLAFVCAQVVAWFGWSNLGLVVAVRGAEALKDSGLGVSGLLVAFIGFAATVNLLIASSSAQWALIAPVFVPMFLLLGVSPALTQAAYRIGDSSTNVVSPLLPYLPLLLTAARRHHPDVGLGTLLAAMVPYAVAFLVTWTAMLLGWVALGLPLGPG